MVVGDDEVKAETRGLLAGAEGPDAGIDADDEADAFGGGELEAGVGDTVALADAVGDVIADVGGGRARRSAVRSMAVLSSTVATVPSTS